MRISEFIEQCNRETSPAAVLSLMQRAAGDFGFDRYAYCALTDHGRYLPVNNPAPAPAVALNYPRSWTDHYFAHRYQAIDPVIVNAPLMEGPFLWDWMGTRYHLSPRQKAVMEEAREAKLRDGVAVPVHGPCGSICLLTFAAGDGHPDAVRFLPRLTVLSMQFHLAYSEIARAEGDLRLPDLSPRERECLQWLAKGKSRWEVGQILHISENTVRFHVKSALKKLDANSQTLAIVKALRYRLIALTNSENYPIG